MMLDDEVGIGRRVRGKGGQNMEQEAADAGKVTMDADLAVVEYLQGNNKNLPYLPASTRLAIWMSSI